MKLAIVGSRNFVDYRLICKEIKILKEKYRDEIDEIVSGGAKLTEKYAIENDIKIKIFEAEWNVYGRAAGPIRNRKIIEYCDYVLAFWDGESRGTKSSIDIAEKLNKPIKIIKF